MFNVPWMDIISVQIGFNSGFARGWTSLPYSETSNVINLDTMSGTNVTGRWVYQISGDVIKHGGCTNSSALGGMPIRRNNCVLQTTSICYTLFLQFKNFEFLQGFPQPKHCQFYKYILFAVIYFYTLFLYSFTLPV